MDVPFLLQQIGGNEASILGSVKGSYFLLLAGVIRYPRKEKPTEASVKHHVQDDTAVTACLVLGALYNVSSPL